MRKVLGAVLVGGVLLMSMVTGLALAQGGSGAPAPAASGANDQQPSYTGSIVVQQDANGHDSESTEAAQYKAMAKVTMDEAVKAAQAALSTTEAPARVSLDNENGYLVWEVVVGGQEVKVDAGTGKVLHSEQASREDNRRWEGEEGERGEH